MATIRPLEMSPPLRCTRWSTQNSTEIIGTASFTTADGNYTVTNTNKLLNNYSGLIGGKTGYDDDSGYCLVEFAERDGSRMISVTLDGEAPDIWYQDNASLLDLGFDHQSQTSRRQPTDHGRNPGICRSGRGRDPASTSAGGSIGWSIRPAEAPVDSNRRPQRNPVPRLPVSPLRPNRIPV